ncbi:TPA_asm: hypothetical protein G1S91_08035 [Salmonella enterica subsp. enterica serovar Typhi str. CT18]|uniref:Uncharacterized protein n=1 Tax=Salmonella enterica subsp. enterica serovar Typhi str. CT18 TaxID=220341 RepID=A0A714QXA8_SALTI|nr:hypothetical protein [Salmonella enterica subsp. enterica serovar Typhi str. CT18]HAG7092465.1 hypothetical protein [Escherichia coli]
MEHLCCSEVSISPLFRWPNSVCRFKSESGRATIDESFVVDGQLMILNFCFATEQSVLLG